MVSTYFSDFWQDVILVPIIELLIAMILNGMTQYAIVLYRHQYHFSFSLTVTLVVIFYLLLLFLLPSGKMTIPLQQSQQHTRRYS